MRSVTLSRRRFVTAALAAAGATAAPALRAQGRPEKARVSIAVGGKAAFHNLPLTIAESLEYFEIEGLHVDIVDHAGSAQALQAVVAGAADVASVAFEHTIQLQARRQYFQSFVLQGRAPQIAMGVSMRAVPLYRSVADLRGKRIGVTSAGSSTHMVASLVLAKAGVRPAEVQFVPVGHSAGALQALRSGQVDALCNVDPVMTTLEQKGEVRVIVDTRSMKGTQEVFGGPMPAACLLAPAEFVQKHPVVCQALANGIVHGLKWLQTAGPSDIIKTVPEGYLLGDRALYLASFNKVREAIAIDGLMPDDGPRTALRALATFEPAVKAERIDLARTFTNDFARRAKEKYKL